MSSDVLIELNDLKLEPLESAFGGRSDLAAVRVEGDIKQGLCAEFKVHVPVPPVSPDPEGDNIEVIILILKLFISLKNNCIYCQLLV